MRKSPVFEQMRREFASDPEYLAERALLEVAEQICAAMERREMSRSDLARAAGVPRQVVTRFLNTPANTTVLTLARFAQALGMDVRLNLVDAPEAQQRSPEQSATQSHLEPAQAA